MSWLNDVDTLIACKHGEVHDKPLDGKPFTIKGARAIPKIPSLSATQMKRYLRKKQEVFTFNIHKISDEPEPNYNEPKNVEDFLANYHNIIFDELPGMPPQREVDHTIELVLGVTLIAKAPYKHFFKREC